MDMSRALSYKHKQKHLMNVCTLWKENKKKSMVFNESILWATLFVIIQKNMYKILSIAIRSEKKLIHGSKNSEIDVRPRFFHIVNKASSLSCSKNDKDRYFQKWCNSFADNFQFFLDNLEAYFLWNFKESIKSRVLWRFSLSINVW